MKRIIAAILLVSALFALCACGEGSDGSAVESSNAEVSQTASEAQSKAESNEESSKDIAEAQFKVKVVDQDGNAVSGVMVQLCKDTCMPAMTNADGVASFNAEITDGHKLSVLSCPAGYTYEGEAEIYLESAITEYTLTLKKGE
ncbi:MAG: hypothetical protein J6Q72_02980 [Clostridia bacterium]|nr:hypothetical protein [Clostridia bacterium]MBO5914289.1 hypothetical protein [Clostridia bacterium]